jgi:hypothetical protein
MLTERLQEAQGILSLDEAMELLASVAQSSTQWSIVYQLHTGQISIAMGRSYSGLHSFQLEVPAFAD